MEMFISGIVKKLKNHYAAIVLSLFIGFITIAPNIFFINSLGDQYRGLYMMKTDAHVYYLAKIQEVYDGNGMVNPYIYEFKFNVPTATPGFAAIPVAYLGMLLNVSAATIGLISSFLFPFLISLLVYIFFFKLTKNKLWSLTALLLVVCGRLLLSAPDIFHLLKFEKIYNQFTIFSRPLIPQVSTFIFFLYLNILIFTIKQKNNLIHFICLGILFGLSFYVYFYCYTFLFVLNVILFFIFLILKKREISKKIFFATILGILIAIPALINLINVIKSPYYDGLANYLELEYSRSFIISTVFVFTTVFSFFYFFYKKRKVSIAEYLLFGLLLTSFVVINQQVITGKVLQEGHYHWFFNIPIFAMIILYILFQLLRKKIFLSLILLFLIFFLSLYSYIFVQYSSYVYWYDDVKRDQRYMPSLKWLKENTKPESVIFANEKISGLVPVFTSNNVVYYYQAYNFLWSEERENFTPKNILNKDFLNEINKFKVDYLIWDKKGDSEWNIDQYNKFIQQVYIHDDIAIYKL